MAMKAEKTITKKSFPTVLVRKILHRGETRIALLFDYHKDIIALIKGQKGSRWSATLKCWHLPDRDDYEFYILHLFNHDVRIVFGRDELKPFRNKQMSFNSLSSIYQLLTDDFTNYLNGMRFSKSTVKTYTDLVKDFFVSLKDKPPDEVSNRDVELYSENILSKYRYSISTHRQFISAIKKLAEYTTTFNIDIDRLEMPKKSRLLPMVLSREEVLDIITHTKNLKHRACITLIYSAGLRIGELIRLELKDIDVDRRQLLVRRGKGRKDRIVVLAESFIPLLKNYFMTYQPKRYFIEGKEGEAYSASSVRKLLTRSCRLAGIIKHVTPHTLRHSYATHLLESGIDLRYIQELLGHARPETTMIYTHVTRKDLLNIRSPLDTVMKQLRVMDKVEENFLLSRSNDSK